MWKLKTYLFTLPYEQFEHAIETPTGSLSKGLWFKKIMFLPLNSAWLLSKQSKAFFSQCCIVKITVNGNNFSASQFIVCNVI